MKKTLCFLGLSLTVFISLPAFSQTIPLVPLKNAPQIDGNADDWGNYPAVTIPLEGELSQKNISVKSAIVGDEVFFLFQWKDTTHDTMHKPYVWDAGQNKYIAGTQKEDRFAITFGMGGDFTYDWFSGNTFTADLWQWKSSRTNPIGLAHDKHLTITTKKSRKAFHATATNGKEIYIMRPFDSGDELYSTKRYATKEKDVMPKYILNENAKGSVTDVKAKGVWQDGQWTLELKRKLDTGHSDDVVIKKGSQISAALALFDRSGDEHHNISRTLTFQF